MFLLTPLVALVLVLTGGGIAAVDGSHADANDDVVVEINEAEVADAMDEPEKLDALVTVNGFPVYTFNSCAKARAKAVEIQKRSPDLQVRAECETSTES